VEGWGGSRRPISMSQCSIACPRHHTVTETAAAIENQLGPETLEPLVV
jgi:hypothetical protein